MFLHLQYIQQSVFDSLYHQCIKWNSKNFKNILLAAKLRINQGKSGHHFEMQHSATSIYDCEKNKITKNKKSLAFSTA